MPYEIEGDLLCWIWTGRTDRTDTPIIRTRTTCTTARRYYWEREKGPVPEGKILAATCGQRLCVNPDHAGPITRSEWNRWRGNSKLDSKAAGRAVAMRLAGMTQEEVAGIMGVSVRTIHRVERGKHWSLREFKPEGEGT